MKDITVIVLSYNQFDSTTQPCLEKLWSLPEAERLEIIVVDNGSTDPDVAQHLQNYARKGLIQAELLDANYGYAAGNNHGIKVATTDCIVLLNSDTQVLEGSLPALYESLNTDEKLGLVAPGTNEAGNEQKITVASKNPEKVLDCGRRWVGHADERVMLSERLDFCCVAIKKRVIESIGYLDESFGLGYYEDFDYCIRAKAAGYKLGLVERAFVYHRGSASFAKMGDRQKQLIDVNKKKLVSKHGHINLPHMREVNLQVLDQYLEQFVASSNNTDRSHIYPGICNRETMKRA